MQIFIKFCSCNAEICGVVFEHVQIRAARRAILMLKYGDFRNF